MLHSDLQTILFSNGMKLGIPDTNNAIHLDNAELQRKARLIATIDLKLRQYGYELDSKGVKKLKNLSDTDIVSFYTAIEPIVKNASGAHIADADIFYPNFPKEVLDKDELSLYMNAFFYYCGEYFLGEDLRPLLDIEKPKQRSSLIESFDRKNTIIRLVDEKEIDQLMLNCTRQSTPMSLSQFEDFKLYCKHTPDWKEKILSQNIPCKENAVQLAMYMYDSYSNKDMTHAQFMKYVSVLLKDTPDVLRFAALISNSKFGFMERYEPVFDTEKMLDVDTKASINGTIFDARTLSSNIVDLNTKSKQSLMTIYDVDRDCFIWIDKDLSLRYGCHNITNPDSVKGAVAVTYKATNYSFASLYELLKAQIEANGELVENVEDADHIFLSTPRDFKNATLKENVEIVTGYDLSKICNEYLIRQNDPISETKLVKNSVKINTEVNTPSVNTDEKNINVKIEEFAR